MAELKSGGDIESRARQLIASFDVFSTSEARRALKQSGAIRSILNLSRSLEFLVIKAESIREHREFPSLSKDIQDDVVAIAEEGRVALNELAPYDDPDQVLSLLPPAKKKELSETVAVSKETADHIFERVNLRKRKQPAIVEARIEPVFDVGTVRALERQKMRLEQNEIRSRRAEMVRAAIESDEPPPE